MRLAWRLGVALACLLFLAPVQAAGDPFATGLWPDLAAEFLNGGSVAFDARVVVTAPKFAEDAMNVPVQVDASALADVERVVVLVDRNPIRKVLEFIPGAARPVLSFRFKLEQASPVRAAVRTRDGTWHVGGTWVDASGGGCTVAGASRRDGSWASTLGQTSARLFERGDAAGPRLRLRVMHPMDTGLVSGIPAFFIDELRLADEGGTEFLRLLTFEPVSENPMFSFDLGRTPSGALQLTGRDNNGNRIRARIGS
jgi:sulfur-oxidizing protein SoxY